MGIKKVYKYVIEPAGRVTVWMPKGAQALYFALQPHVGYCLWALIDPTAELEARQFRWAGTGHSIYEPSERLRYINSLMEDGGQLVWHLFEILPSEEAPAASERATS